MARPRYQPDERRCSFCNKSDDEVVKVLPGPNGVAICDECIDLCNDILRDTRVRSMPLEPAAEAGPARSPSPPTLGDALHDLKRLVDSQEQLIVEQRAFSRRYGELFANLLDDPT